MASMDIYVDMKILAIITFIDEDNCLICMEKIYFPHKLSCNHKFHKKCWNKWSKINTTCPLCRKKQSFYYTFNIFNIIDCFFNIIDYLYAFNNLIIEYHKCIHPID